MLAFWNWNGRIWWRAHNIYWYCPTLFLWHAKKLLPNQSQLFFFFFTAGGRPLRQFSTSFYPVLPSCDVKSPLQLLFCLSLLLFRCRDAQSIIFVSICCYISLTGILSTSISLIWWFPQMSCTPVFLFWSFLDIPIIILSIACSVTWSFFTKRFLYTRGQVWCTDQIPSSSGRLEGLSHEVYQQVINVVIFDPTSRQLINDRAPKQYSCPHQLYFEDELWMFEWNICFEYPLWIAVFWSRSVVGETLSNVHLPMKRQVWHIAVVHFSIF